MNNYVFPKSVTKQRATKSGNVIGIIPNDGVKLKNAIAEINKSDQARVNYTIFERGITATAGGDQSTAYQLNNKAIQVVETVATDNDPVKLPAVELGLLIRVVNKGEALLTVYPTVGQYMNGGLNDQVDIAVGEAQYFLGVSATEWLSI